MARRIAFLAGLFLLAASTTARAADAELRLGGDVLALLREEAGGNRSVHPAPSLRASLFPSPYVGVTATLLGTTTGPVGGAAGAFTWLGYGSLRVDGRLPIATHALVGGLGPSMSLASTTLSDRGEAKASVTVTRPGVTGLLGVESRVGAITWRASSSFAWHANGRTDLWFGLGADWSLGGAR